MFKAIESHLLGTVTEILLSADADADPSTPRKRYLACRRALHYAERLDGSIKVPDLAVAASVSQRVLELDRLADLLTTRI